MSDSVQNSENLLNTESFYGWFSFDYGSHTDEIDKFFLITSSISGGSKKEYLPERILSPMEKLAVFRLFLTCASFAAPMDIISVEWVCQPRQGLRQKFSDRGAGDRGAKMTEKWCFCALFCQISSDENPKFLPTGEIRCLRRGL